MEKVLTNQTAKNLLVVEVSPQALREVADRLELSSKEGNFHSGETIFVQFTHRIILQYRPDRPAKALESEGPPGVMEHAAVARAGLAFSSLN